MLCEICKQNEAMIHTGTVFDESAAPAFEHHYCRDCYDDYCKSNGMNSARDLVQLSERYRSKLYDALERDHPEVFQHGMEDNSGRIMTAFLAEELKREGIEINEDGFGMLLGSFIGAAEFYERRDRRKG